MQGVLHRLALMRGERVEERSADRAPRGVEVQIVLAVAPRRRQRCREDPVTRLRKSRKFVANEPVERRMAGLHDQEVRHSRADERARAAHLDCRGAPVRPLSHERIPVLPALSPDSRPAVLDEVNADSYQPWIPIQEVPGQVQSEFLRLAHAVPCGQRIDGVFHRVGGEHRTVVAVGIGFIVVAPEPDGDGEVAKVVTAGASQDLNEPDPGLSICGTSKHAQLPPIQSRTASIRPAPSRDAG
jgi:hypothetical protein